MILCIRNKVLEGALKCYNTSNNGFQLINEMGGATLFEPQFLLNRHTDTEKYTHTPLGR